MKTKVWIIFGLVFLSIRPVFAETTAENLSAEAAAKAFVQLDAENKYTEQLTYSDLNVLPIGMKKTISNNEFTIAISNVKFYDSYAELTLFARMKLDQRKEPLFFAASGVRFSADGGFMGNAKLNLIKTVNIPVNEHTTLKLIGGIFNTQSGTIEGDNISSVSVDCSGFKELAVSAELSFSTDFITQVSDTGEPTGQPVSASFFVVINDWNNLLVQLSLPRFKINNLGEFIFELSDIVFDYSDFRNSESMVFPPGYLQKYVAGTNELWRGVYARNITVTLPKDFSNGGKAVSFSAQNLIIDERGISGKFSVNHILPVESGNASGWAFSIDEFHLEMEAHRVISGGFAGMLGLPVSEKGAYLDYIAQIAGKDKYELVVMPKDSLDFDMFAAKAVLNRNSTISLTMDKGKFLAEANLTGYMTINAPLVEGGGDNKKASIKDIEFRELRLRTQAPYMTVGYLGYNGTINILNLPVSVSKITLEAPGDMARLGFDVVLNLDPRLIAASTRLEITSVYGMQNNRGHWKYKNTSINDVAIKNCGIAGIFTLDGRLKLMNNDPVYGDGFYGEIKLSFQKVIKDLKVETAAAFGQKNGNRYWFVDGSVVLPTVIPVVGFAGINGFAGGASNGMKHTTSEGTGLSRTGCGYVPDPNMGLGVKAGVMFASTGSKIMTGQATFEVLFTQSGGIHTIGFYGLVQFTANLPGVDALQNSVTSVLKKYVDKENALVQGSLEKLKKLEDKKNSDPTGAAKDMTDAEKEAGNATLAIAVGILYDFYEETLHATFDFYVNVAGGVVRGPESNNRAGWGVLHISPQEWYILMGTPDKKVGLQIGIPGVATVTSESYFMLGNNIPGSPPPPKEVVTILAGKGESYDYMHDLNSLGSGRGIAFGTSFSFNTGDLTFLILYARFGMTMGFDLMLKDYGAAQCEGHSGPIGMNGWYANGQAYAAMTGELGVKVNLLFVKGRFAIIKGGAAMLLQSTLPNPTWFGGKMAVDFSLLGGLVRGNMKFEFNFGDKCKVVLPGASPIDIPMISDLKPIDNSREVDVFTAPQLALAAAEGQEFPFEDESGEKKYRIALNRFVVKDGSKELPGEIKWNRDKTVATFYSYEVLPPNKQLSLEVAVGFDEKNANGSWKTVYTSGQKAEEIRKLSFTTGEAPDYIPVENIEYAYPLVGQKYYYPSEFLAGYVQLKRGQSYLFPANGWTYQVQIAREGKTEKLVFTYDSGNKKIRYSLPDLSRSKNYLVQFLCIPQAGNSGEAVNQVKETTLLKEGENIVVQTGASANEVLRSDVGKSLLEYNFSSSMYATFQAKVAGLKKGSYQVELAGSNVLGLGWTLTSMPEAFENMEVFGTRESAGQSLIYAEATLKDSYYKNRIYPLLYKEYHSWPIRLSREGDAIGIPPVHAFDKFLVLDGIESDRMKFPVRYALPRYYLSDYNNIRNMSTNSGLTGHPLYAHPYFPDIESGTYSAILQYILPGGEKGSQVEFDYKINKQ